MKKLLLLIAGIILSVGIYAQPSNSNYNFTRETVILTPGVTEASQADLLDADKKSVKINYVDGLGRPIQTVVWQGSPNKKDIIQPFAYDEFGRQPINYLPYVDLTGDGNYRSNALNTIYSSCDHFKFYTNGYYNAPDVAEDLMNAGEYSYNTALTDNKDIVAPGSVVLRPGFSTNGHTLSITVGSANDPSQASVAERITPFAVTVFEPSPLNRVLEQGAPGFDWQPIDQSGSSIGHTSKITYATNTATDVPLWTVDNASSALTRATANSGYYAAGTLYVTSAKNANWKSTDGNVNTTTEYKDLAGRTIMSTSYAAATDAVSTYYVYDDMGRLRYTLPPLAMDQLTGTSYTQTDNVIKNLCFYYNYDQKGRMTEKHVPGAEPIYMVYDNRNRLVMTQDGNLRQNADGTARNQWSFTKYDVLNRPIMIGSITYTTDPGQSSLQSTANGFTVFAESPAANTTGYTVTNTFPVLDATVTSDILSITYYDGYDFNNDGTDDYTYQNITGYTNQPFYRLTGEVTGTRTKILGTGTFQTSVVFYDKYGQAIQTLVDNYLGGQDVVTSEYAFSGEVLKTNHQQTIVNGTTQTLTTDERFTYDHARRLTATYHTINGGAEVNTSQLAYNELGQLSTKKLHVNGSSYAQKVDFTYNIQGKLKTINNPDDLLPSTENDAFGMRLLFNDVTALTATGVTPTQQFTGNIAGIIWKGKDDSNPTAYTYTYDPLDRLKEGTLAIKTSGTWAASNNFAEKGITYDKNGNIQTLVRNANTGLTMDNLTYNYGSGATFGNKLLSVQDASIKITGFIDNANTTTEYAYDVNGNLIRDDNKGITNIEYNILDLPKKVTFASDKYIEYIYNAEGEKLAKKVTNGATVMWHYYIGNVEYDANKNFVLLNFAYGRVTKPTGNYSYEYFITDHLGNTRAIVNQDKTVLQAVNYYPFGMTQNPVSPDNDNQYLYNGKEIQKEFAFLNYDFNHRYYDPLLCRFTSQDGLAEEFSYMSPYQYGSNNPSTLIELDGLEGVDFTYMALAMQLGSGGFTSTITITMGQMPNTYYEGNHRNILPPTQREPTPPKLESLPIRQIPPPDPEMKSIMDNHITGTYTTWTPSFTQRWSMSTGFVGQLTYGLVDAPFVALQSFFTGSPSHIGGTLASNADKTNAIVEVAMLFVPGGGEAKGLEATGQLHHLLSNKIMRALESHPNLAGVFEREDASFIYRAADKAAHKGYQEWHREYDSKVVQWLHDNANASAEQFREYLHNLYQQPELKARIPNVKLK